MEGEKQGSRVCLPQDWKEIATVASKRKQMVILAVHGRGKSIDPYNITASKDGGTEVEDILVPQVLQQ